MKTVPERRDDLIPTSPLLQLEAGRNFETFIASTSGLKPFSSTDHVFAIVGSSCGERYLYLQKVSLDFQLQHFTYTSLASEC